MINKELFLDVMNDLERANNYHEELNSFFETHDVDGYIFQPDCSTSVIKLLHNIFGDLDKDDWISYFCFDLDFGRNYKDGMVTHNGKNVSLATSEDLYDFLISFA